MKNEMASQVFDLFQLRDKLPRQIFDRFKATVDEKSTLDDEVAELVAREIKKWAEQNGVTHYTHWFQPLTGLTAGKQNSFFDRDDEGRVISRFGGQDLIKGESDSSSFPHGGMRSTFEARGYTAWDPSSPVFIVRNSKSSVLVIPSVYFGYHGEVLDKKTPLLRSLRLINHQSLLLLRSLGVRRRWVKNMIGPEQEFFLVAEEQYLQRPDLRTCGRIIFGARPARGQQMGDHYFGTIPDRVLAYLEDVEEAATRLGVPIKTRHNEVAPNQFEIAPLYEEANLAADHNQLLMETLSGVARRHRMVCLLHEKPFYFFNGSGKHVNWSLMDDQGHNLFSLGKNRKSRLTFLAVMCGFLIGLERHHDLLLSVLSSPGNELRLGGHEAPPAIISVYLGEELSAILDDAPRFWREGACRRDPLQFEAYIPAFEQDRSDRNRTSPVAFTGNKFEFRMPGSSASIAFPTAVINLMVADGLAEVSAALQNAGNDTTRLERLQTMLQEHRGIVFDGDNYSRDWRDEAVRRGLQSAGSVPDSVALLSREKNIALFERHQLLSRDEILARAQIKTEMYIKTVEMELRVTRAMLRGCCIPAAMKNQQLLLANIRGFPQDLLEDQPELLAGQKGFLVKFTQKINRAMELLAALDDDNEKLKQFVAQAEAARYCSRVIRPRIEEAARLAGKIEERVDPSLWGMPHVADLLFR